MSDREEPSGAKASARCGDAGTKGTVDSLHPELDRRLVAIESGAEGGSDFDAASWVWMILLGLVLPIALLIWGWIG